MADMMAGKGCFQNLMVMNKLKNRVVLFEIERCKVVALDESDAPALQQFFECVPEYFQICNGRPPVHDEAMQELRSTPPADMPFVNQWFLAVVDEEGKMVAMATVLSDFIAERVWLLSLFIVAPALHGTGQARIIYERLETWMRDSGAEWIRLGVVKGNVKAERFWEKMGYVQVRERNGIPLGIQVNTLRVMVKSLADSSLAEYLLKVQRDRPE